MDIHTANVLIGVLMLVLIPVLTFTFFAAPAKRR